MSRYKLFTFAVSVAIALVTLLSQQSLSYYAVLGEAQNVVTTGDVQIQVIEKMGDGDFPQGGVYITPGSIVSKKVSVANIGGNPCWLRVSLTNGIDDEKLSADIYELDINTQDWTDGRDGYYYYNNILQPGVETEKLFTQVKIAGATDTRYAGKTLKLTVNAYAVQSEYNDPTGSPLDVQGWPAESRE